MSQAELAALAGISRTGLVAIEARQLTPSVSTAIALAQALGMTVESLFGEARAPEEDVWVSEPEQHPVRYWAAEVGGRIVRYPLEPTFGFFQRQDGVAKRPGDRRTSEEVARRTLVAATCDPAIGLLASIYERRTPFRFLALHRASGAALEMLRHSLVHVAGVHFAPVNADSGNSEYVAQNDWESDVVLLSAGSWEEGIAHTRQLKLRSARQATQTRVSWIGRLPGAGARRTQDEVLQGRRPPRYVAAGHFDVVSSIRSGFSEAGICSRWVAEEAGVGFFPVGEDQYDLVYSSECETDPRVTALVEVLRSKEYREAVAELPGYGVKRIGERLVIRRDAQGKEAG